MAREVHDREDLLGDATALVPRVQLRLSDSEVFAGFRAGSALSLFFDAALVYHFNGRGELRRAFVDDRLLKAERGQIVALSPQRGTESTDLRRHELNAAETEEFCGNLTAKLARLRKALGAKEFSILGQFPADGDGLARLMRWLADFESVGIAQSPRVAS